MEPTLIELEREQEDLLIIGHASVIRCLLAYLIGLPAPEVPAIEVARGDLIEVVPTSYGVRYQTFHFWDGPGRSEETEGDEEDAEDEEEQELKEEQSRRERREAAELEARTAESLLPDSEVRLLRFIFTSHP